MITEIKKDIHGNVVWNENSKAYSYASDAEYAKDAIKRAEARGLSVEEYKVPAENYADLRRAEYPPIGDQLDALYKARNGDTTELETLDIQIADIKAKYPTPVLYDLNSTGTYHRQSCQHCGDTLDLYTLEELAELKSTPCAVCSPPKYEGYSTIGE